MALPLWLPPTLRLVLDSAATINPRGRCPFHGNSGLDPSTLLRGLVALDLNHRQAWFKSQPQCIPARL